MAWQALLLFLMTPSPVAPPGQPASEEKPPKLLLFVTVDQARGDYLDRFRPALHGGLAKIHDEGLVFTDAHQHHAITVTAAGHASLSTGLYPGHSGMVGNNFYDRSQARQTYCVEDGESPILAPADGRRGWRGGSGRSPKQLLGTGLGDWVKRSIPGAKVYSLGGKDRSAVLMGGKNADGAFWYDPRSGQWVSSRHYYQEYPDWVQAFQRARPADAYLGSTWSPLAVEASALERMEIHSAPWHSYPFPKSLGRATLTPDASFFDGVFSSPFIESYLLSFAERLVVEEGVGDDDTLDVLALSFSSIDSVGHEYGPNSRELLDAVMRLDGELDRFFQFLDEKIGLSRVAIVLSADHGVAPLPGEQEEERTAERSACFQRVGRAFEARFGMDEWFVAPLHFDYETLERRRVSRAEAESFLATELGKCPSVARVWTRTELEEAQAGRSWLSETGQLYTNSFHPMRSPDLYVQLEEFRLPSTGGTTHGSPYRYDTYVTAAILWPGVAPGRVTETIATVDLPVTVAALLGVAVPEGLDGIDRSALIRGRRSPSPQ